MRRGNCNQEEKNKKEREEESSSVPDPTHVRFTCVSGLVTAEQRERAALRDVKRA